MAPAPSCPHFPSSSPAYSVLAGLPRNVEEKGRRYEEFEEREKVMSLRLTQLTPSLFLSNLTCQQRARGPAAECGRPRPTLEGRQGEGGGIKETAAGGGDEGSSCRGPGVQDDGQGRVGVSVSAEGLERRYLVSAD